MAGNLVERHGQPEHTGFHFSGMVSFFPENVKEREHEARWHPKLEIVFQGAVGKNRHDIGGDQKIDEDFDAPAFHFLALFGQQINDEDCHYHDMKFRQHQCAVSQFEFHNVSLTFWLMNFHLVKFTTWALFSFIIKKPPKFRVVFAYEASFQIEVSLI